MRGLAVSVLGLCLVAAAVASMSESELLRGNCADIALDKCDSGIVCNGEILVLADGEDYTAKCAGSAQVYPDPKQICAKCGEKCVSVNSLLSHNRHGAAESYGASSCPEVAKKFTEVVPDPKNCFAYRDTCPTIDETGKECQECSEGQFKCRPKDKEGAAACTRAINKRESCDDFSVEECDGKMVKGNACSPCGAKCVQISTFMSNTYSLLVSCPDLSAKYCSSTTTDEAKAFMKEHKLECPCDTAENNADPNKCFEKRCNICAREKGGYEEDKKDVLLLCQSNDQAAAYEKRASAYSPAMSCVDTAAGVETMSEAFKTPLKAAIKKRALPAAAAAADLADDLADAALAGFKSFMIKAVKGEIAEPDYETAHRDFVQNYETRASWLDDDHWAINFSGKSKLEQRDAILEALKKGPCGTKELDAANPQDNGGEAPLDTDGEAPAAGGDGGVSTAGADASGDANAPASESNGKTEVDCNTLEVPAGENGYHFCDTNGCLFKSSLDAVQKCVPKHD